MVPVANIFLNNANTAPTFADSRIQEVLRFRRPELGIALEIGGPGCGEWRIKSFESSVTFLFAMQDSALQLRG
jgi:hypothetical protein